MKTSPNKLDFELDVEAPLNYEWLAGDPNAREDDFPADELAGRIILSHTVAA